LHLLGTHQEDEGFVLLEPIDSDMVLPVAVGADSRYGVWMIRTAVGESVEVVHFKVWAPLTVEGSRLEAAFAAPAARFREYCRIASARFWTATLRRFASAELLAAVRARNRNSLNDSRDSVEGR
jgi:hypothetical protein